MVPDVKSQSTPCVPDMVHVHPVGAPVEASWKTTVPLVAIMTGPGPAGNELNAQLGGPAGSHPGDNNNDKFKDQKQVTEENLDAVD